MKTPTVTSRTAWIDCDGKRPIRVEVRSDLAGAKDRCESAAQAAWGDGELALCPSTSAFMYEWVRR